MIYFVTYSTIDPSLTWISTKNVWVLNEPISVSFVGKDNERREFVISAGFETDLASIPRLFQVLIPQIGGQNLPAIAHDWCYRDASMKWLNKSAADLLFRIGMEQAGVSRLRRTLIYWAVKWFGFSSYQPKHTK
ncbi:DUF1353 domain-containing protein [Kiloniella sp. EL199]|uniref:DUF1353 domain-containing protein n=1 Tax=Kiloniella sp. EL199 TaxID=2107581 RepID=UPI000EA38F2C|nr:DUF1353 domain-containing protein [Kiloniella sp. EL199]